MKMHSVDSTESQENPKNLVAKFYPSRIGTQAAVTFLSSMLLSELIPLFAGSLSPLLKDPYVVILY